MVRMWLEQQSAAPADGSDSPERLIIATGWGKTRDAWQTGDVRGRVSRVLDDMGAPTMASDNPGRLIVDAPAWRQRYR